MADTVGLDSRAGVLVGVDVDTLVAKAGGRYRFVTLIQRRMRDLQRGAQPLIGRAVGNLMHAALEEYHQGKIWLVKGEEAEKLREELARQHAPRPSPGQAGGGAIPTSGEQK